MTWQQKIDDALTARRRADAWRRRYAVTQGAGRWLQAGGRQYLNFSSNDYLGLSQHPAIIRAWQQGAERYGVGSGGSGHVSGYTTAHQALEEELAAVQATLAEESLQHSWAGRLGMAIEPLTKPVGFDWRTDVALIGGIAAKEAIVSTLGTAYSLGEQDPEEATSLAERLAQDPNWNKATALSLMLFVLLYSPCFVALVVIRQEAGSWGWVAFSMIFNTVFAYGVAAAAYRICMAL